MTKRKSNVGRNTINSKKIRKYENKKGNKNSSTSNINSKLLTEKQKACSVDQNRCLILDNYTYSSKREM